MDASRRRDAKPGRVAAATFAAGLLAAVLAGCAAEPAATSASDMKTYASTAELLADADLVVEVTVGGSRPDVLLPSDVESDDPRLNPSAGMPAADEAAEDAASIPITVYDTVVERVHAGDAVVGAHLEVKQMRGGQGSESDDVPLEEGSTYLLFLATYDDSSASILGGSAGQFVRDGDAYISQYTAGRLELDLDSLR
ncbi:hypothetical protein IF188_18835 [Microbacterium sp. NEAU-LLC]|uniref:Uncharacterized protein n=1 Tax=Microbacterium helvum TaxID=2773713 RepID=A0ABR8NUN0_9MICO|nr:hypothetical protein [Microbacterium helvum]MBD3943753.1 hypothetical protein [Microbacterium helvum]